MKLQHLAVVFCIIIIPISLVLSTYTGNLISVANTRAEYDAVIKNATYDAVRAYQLNTMHNSYASVNKSRERDMLAAVNTFYSSLSSGLTLNGYSKAELNTFIPAILFTLYDGYYVYGPIKNTVSISDGSPQYSQTDDGNIEFGLKPYVYYSCEYAGINYDITVNYTLDNYITVSGTSDAKYITAAGYYVNPNTITLDSNNRSVTIRKGSGTNEITIEPERLGEYITFSDQIEAMDYRNTTSSDTTTRVVKTKASEVPVYYNYINYNEQKYYYERGDTFDNTTYNGVPIFYLENYSRVYISPDLEKEITRYIWGNESRSISDFNNFYDTNAYHYYEDACDFSNAVNVYLKDIDINSGVVKNKSYNEEYTISTDDSRTAISGNTAHTKAKYDGEAKPFDYSSGDNNPEEETSIFNNHRIDVIVSSIESSLVNSIGNFNNYVSNTYSYAMPTLSEEDWYTIATNVTTVAFMEGIPVGNYEYYSNYAVVANTKNKEFISKESIFVQDGITKIKNNDGTENTINTLDGSIENRNNMQDLYKNMSLPPYHYPGCDKYNKDSPSSVIGYRNLDYDLQPIENSYVEVEWKDGNWWVVRYSPDYYTINITKEQTQSINYYLQPGTSSYECVISRNDNDITLDDIIKQKTEVKITRDNGEVDIYNISKEIERAYIAALAREKGVAYKNHSNLNYHQYNSSKEEVLNHSYDDITSNFR